MQQRFATDERAQAQQEFNAKMLALQPRPKKRDPMYAGFMEGDPFSASSPFDNSQPFIGKKSFLNRKQNLV
jgi:hypothetical protein